MSVVETGQKAKTSDQGNYSLKGMKPGKYTLVFAKDEYVRTVKTDVIVAAGRLTDVNVALAGEYTDMEEFVVQDVLSVGGGTEAALLNLRFESPAMMDSISADLMSRAGASDAAAALRLVSGATIKDGKSAVIRGLPDRYVSSQLNGVRLPTSDEDKRAVELDQFPAAAIESIQVTKTFTPDQQGDASGGAVDVRLKTIPDEFFFSYKLEYKWNTQVARNRDKFLSYSGGGVNFWGKDSKGRGIQSDRLGENWLGDVGAKEVDAPTPDYKFALATGGKYEIDDGVKIGAFGSFFYDHDTFFDDSATDDTYWVENPGQPMTPKAFQGAVQEGDFKTQLLDVTRSVEEVQWGGLGRVGIETENHEIGVTYLYTRTTADKVTLATDTRGKQYFFPGHDPYDPNTPGHDEQDAAPYNRTETLDYTERYTQSVQLSGAHTFEIDGFGPFGNPELDWTAAFSRASFDQPDKRQFGATWFPERQVGSITIPAQWNSYKPSANFTLGNLQRIWKSIEEDSDQYFSNLKLPFEQWSEDKGYIKLGFFSDSVDREFDQDTFSNFSDPGISYQGDFFGQPWSRVFPYEDHPITAADTDVDYDGELDIWAWYLMADVPSPRS